MQQKISILEVWHERQGLVRCVTYFSKLKYTYQGSCHNSENYTNSTLLGPDNTISKQISLHQTTTASKIDLAPSIKMVTQNVNNTSMTTHKTNNDVGHQTLSTSSKWFHPLTAQLRVNKNSSSSILRRQQKQTGTSFKIMTKTSQKPSQHNIIPPWALDQSSGLRTYTTLFYVNTYYGHGWNSYLWKAHPSR